MSINFSSGMVAPNLGGADSLSIGGMTSPGEGGGFGDVLKNAISNAKLGREEALGALKRLDDQSRLLERHAHGPSFDQHVAAERTASSAYGGRSVFGWETDVEASAIAVAPGHAS